jgi:hypothetical protein
MIIGVVDNQRSRGGRCGHGRGRPGTGNVCRGPTLDGIDEAGLTRIAKARARVRRHVWGLLALRPGGFPWLVVAGKLLAGWVVIDLDATLITAHSVKAGAAATFKRGYGFHPLAAWCANRMGIATHALTQIRLR